MKHDSSRPLIAVNNELNIQYVFAYFLDEFRHSLREISEGHIDVSPLVTGETNLMV
ncbi:MAG: hypothetical protein ACJ0Q6_06455 [Candidatus Azotimanducaceae bacterium]